MKKEELTVIKTEEVVLNFYAVRSKDGKWLRAKGYGGGGENWVDDITKAKIYGKPGPAKSQITFWTNNYPKFGVPELVRIVSGKCEYIDATKHVLDSQRKAKIQKLKRDIDMLKDQQYFHQKEVAKFRGDGNDAKSLQIKKDLEKMSNELKGLTAK